jgi:PleD family two-component response regulator
MPIRGMDPVDVLIVRERLPMLTNAATAPTEPMSFGGRPASSAEAQKVVIVNGSAEMLEAIETVLQAGHYDIVFVESNEHAYSQVKRVQPDLVILCVRLDDLDGFQVLSMLKLDEDTRRIPVLTYTTEFEGGETEDEQDEEPEAQMFAPAAVPPRMN